MIKRVIDLLQGTSVSAAPANSADSSYDTLLAVCALFLEIAAIDGKFTERERERIISILQDEYGLSHEDVAELIRASKEELKGSSDYWQFTNLINQNYTMGEKSRIIELLWKVVFTDGKIEKHEEYLMRKIARLLEIPHRELIAAKLKMRG